MQERFYESGNCVQKNCAILGVHPRNLGPTWVQNPGQLAPFSSLSSGRATESTRFMERAMGIEPTSEAWEASILPLYDARSIAFDSTQYCNTSTIAGYTNRIVSPCSEPLFSLRTSDANKRIRGHITDCEIRRWPAGPLGSELRFASRTFMKAC